MSIGYQWTLFCNFDSSQIIHLTPVFTNVNKFLSSVQFDCLRCHWLIVDLFDDPIVLVASAVLATRSSEASVVKPAHHGWLTNSTDLHVGFLILVSKSRAIWLLIILMKPSGVKLARENRSSFETWVCVIINVIPISINKISIFQFALGNDPHHNYQHRPLACLPPKWPHVELERGDPSW